MLTTIERIAHKAQVRDAQKRLARIEEMRDALSLEQEGMSQRDIAQALGTTQPRVRRLLQGARSFETTSITPEEVILRATVEETDRDALVKELSSFTYTATRVAPYPHDGSVTGTWSQVSAAHRLGLLSDEEYESVSRAVKPPTPR